MMAQTTRETRGLVIALGNQIKRLNASTYKVQSQSGNGWYSVLKGPEAWACDCPDFQNRHVKCKHIYAVEFSVTLRERVASENLGLENLCAQPTACKFCGSTNLIKRGIKKYSQRTVQQFGCKDCGKRFIISEDGFRKMENNPKVITLALVPVPRPSRTFKDPLRLKSDAQAI